MITEQQLIEAIRQRAEHYPDRVYVAKPASGQVCSYLPNDLNDCGCGVGEALLALGVPRERLETIDSMMTNCRLAIGWGIPRVWVNLSTRVDPGALASRWVQYFQSAQDRGLTLREAVELSDRLMQEVRR